MGQYVADSGLVLAGDCVLRPVIADQIVVGE
jgi:hypothetical protein